MSDFNKLQYRLIPSNVSVTSHIFIMYILQEQGNRLCISQNSIKYIIFIASKLAVDVNVFFMIYLNDILKSVY